MKRKESVVFLLVKEIRRTLLALLRYNAVSFPVG